MNCPFCQYHDSKVVDSRDISDGIRRRRECLACGSRFTTYERLQMAGLFVIKKDQRREEFNRDKLLAGLRKACEKRPLPIGTIDRIAEDIEADLYSMGKAEIPSAVIGDMVMKRLKKLDYIAYIRFASVYRQFTDITALKQEIDSLVDDQNMIENQEKAAEVTSQLPLIPEEVLSEGKKRRRSRR
jgi:transcriptional repressor NrdR